MMSAIRDTRIAYSTDDAPVSVRRRTVRSQLDMCPPESRRPPRRSARRSAQVVTRQLPMLLAVLLKMADRFEPSRLTATMMMMAMRATSRPYSTAEAPRSVFATAARRMRRYSMASIMMLSPNEFLAVGSDPRAATGRLHEGRCVAVCPYCGDGPRPVRHFRETGLQ